MPPFRSAIPTTGVLPLALGEATKTVAYAMSSRKCYRFRICWGVARDTDDCEGTIVGESSSRPSRAEIEAILPRFTGAILQSPPVYSAIKVDGRRAYALARAATPPTLPRRPVQITALRLIAVPDCDHADCEALVGKGTYIRALARDLAIALGTVGHVVERRDLSPRSFEQDFNVGVDITLTPVDLGKQSLNMHVTAVLNKALSQQVGGNQVGGFMNTALANNQGELVLPVIVTGTLQHPQVEPDLKMIAQMRLQNLLPTSKNPGALTDSLLGAVMGGKQSGANGQQKGGLGGILNAIGGQKQQNQPTQSQQQPVGAGTPQPQQNSVVDLLNQMMDKKKKQSPPPKPPQ